MPWASLWGGAREEPVGTEGVTLEAKQPPASAAAAGRGEGVRALGVQERGAGGALAGGPAPALGGEQEGPRRPAGDGDTGGRWALPELHTSGPAGPAVAPGAGIGRGGAAMPATARPPAISTKQLPKSLSGASSAGGGGSPGWAKLREAFKEERSFVGPGGFAAAVSAAAGGKGGDLLARVRAMSVSQESGGGGVPAIHTGGPRRAKAYDPKENLRNLLAWDGTVLKLLLRKPDFWFLLTLHVALQAYYHVWAEDDEREDWPEFTGSTLLLLGGGFLTFFVVFFNSQAYARFFQEYDVACKVRYATNNLFLLARLHCKDPAKQLSVLRYVHASVYLHYAYLDQNREMGGFRAHVYEKLVGLSLLTRREAERLRAMRFGSPGGEALLWALGEVWELMNAGDIKPPIYRFFEGQLFEIRTLFDQLRSFNEQPIPFAYFHLVNILVEAYLVCLAYFATFVTPYWSILGYAVTLVALLGLREASANLADPLGLDETDLPVFLMAADTHFEHMYVLGRMAAGSPTPGALVPGFGSKECFDTLATAPVDPSAFEGNGGEPDPGAAKVLSVQGEHRKFWAALAAGSEADARRELEAWRRRVAVKGDDDDEEDVDDDDDDDG